MRFRNFVMTAAATAIAVLVGAFWQLAPFDHTQATAQVTSPKITIATHYYAVKGDTADQIRRHLNQVGPFVHSSNRRFDGYTHWQIRWQYWYTKTNNACRVRKAIVNTDVTMTLPKWQAARQPSPGLTDHWNAYVAALKQHEAGHQQNGISASGEILSALQTFPPYPTCNELSQAANATGNHLVQKYAKQDVEYDRATQHGANQGAMFP
jgi:predicted secreted Zn-dependent protease